MAQQGRPKIENPKSKPIHVRLDSKEIEILNTYSQMNGITKTEAIRHGIHLLESTIK